MNQGGGGLGTVPERHDVRLSVPAEPAHLRAVRLVAADTASRAGLDFERTDDLRIALDEICHGLARVAAGPITLAFTSAAGSVTVEGGARLVDGHREVLRPLSRTIVESVTDFFEVVHSPPEVAFMLIMRGAS